MQKSFIDRIFPRSSQTLLPQHEQAERRARLSSRPVTSSSAMKIPDRTVEHLSDVLTRSSVHSSGSNASTSLNTMSRSLPPAPMAASVLHHNDPFLPVERAARALQETMQSLLDVQSHALNGRINGVEEEDVLSGGSLTPTQTVKTPGSFSEAGTIPIRQPIKKKIGLRGARKGLSRKMQEFARLREEELHIIDSQANVRAGALDRVQNLEARREACTTQIESIRSEDTTEAVNNLRDEARTVELEIEELEHKLLELRVRHRHLLGQADQLESSQESKVSSFQGTISIIDRETRDFLRRPPVLYALTNGLDSEYSNMYMLKPDRRTLDMAKQQWATEQKVLAQRRLAVENERTALVEGEQVWSEAVRRIDHFEQNLRTQLALVGYTSDGELSKSMEKTLSDLDSMIEALESDLNLAESRNWNLLICAIGAELEAFQQAHSMLTHTRRTADGLPDGGGGADSSGILEASAPLTSPNGSAGSNQSLNDTLNEFSNRPDSTTVNEIRPASRYESEDDEPPADFLVSR